MPFFSKQKKELNQRSVAIAVDKNTKEDTLSTKKQVIRSVWHIKMIDSEKIAAHEVAKWIVVFYTIEQRFPNWSLWTPGDMVKTAQEVHGFVLVNQ